MSPSKFASIGFINLGCAKNLVDSEIMAGRLLAAGWPLAPQPDEAEIVIVNTCAFILEAKQESLAAIFEACSWKKKGTCRAVLVAGCLSQRYRQILPKSMPEVDAWIGLDEIDKITAVLERLLDGQRGFSEISRTAHAIIEPPLKRPIFTGAPFAYIKIAEGCNHRCRFCSIPNIRGRQRSRPIKRILAEAEALLAGGIRELNLISQDISCYGRDLSKPTNLANLLRALGSLGGRFWIRLLYSHPAGINADLLEAMAQTSQVCHYLDIPIQHSHPKILAAMGRPAQPGGLQQLLSRIRKALPDVALRTTCLVGFPGERPEHFQHLMNFIAEERFEHLGVFAYSREEGTPAAKLPGQVAGAIAKRRRDQLMSLQQKIVFQRNLQRLGQTAEILIEQAAEPGQDTWLGRNSAQAPEVDGVVFFKTGRTAHRAGDFMKVRYSAAAGYDMIAQPLKSMESSAL